MRTTENTVIDSFIIEVSLISPIQKIINQLTSGKFRDCDIKWLDSKLYGFMKIAAETFGISTIYLPNSTFNHFNSYVTEYYLKYFNGLLNYFKSFKS